MMKNLGCSIIDARIYLGGCRKQLKTLSRKISDLHVRKIMALITQYIINGRVSERKKISYKVERLEAGDITLRKPLHSFHLFIQHLFKSSHIPNFEPVT
jgi:hypothetical protein